MRWLEGGIRMAKDLPYFKFYPTEWISGDITLEDLKTQGLFINICCYYWSQECVVSLEKLQKRFKNNKKQIQNLKNEEIIFSDGDKIKIKFLDKQWQEREEVKHKNKANGLKGGRPKKTQSVNSGLAKNNPNITNIEEKREEENSSLSWLDSAKPEYLEFCEKYFNMLLANGKVKKNMNWKTKTWYDAARLLVERDDENIERMYRVLEYTNKNIDDQYYPQVWSVPSLREKWLKIKAHFDKNNKPKLTVDNWKMH